MRKAAILVLYLAIMASAAAFLASRDLLVVRTDSMSPMIGAGDAIVTEPFRGQVAVGDIITFEWDDKLITHRVFEVLPEGLRTKGDNNDLPDDWIVPLAAVQRVFRFRIPYLGYAISYLHTRTGWFVCVIVPAIVMVLNETRIIVREVLRVPKATKEQSA